MIEIPEAELARYKRIEDLLRRGVATMDHNTLWENESRKALLPVHEPLVSKEEWARHFNDNSLTQSDLEYAHGGLVLGLRKASGGYWLRRR